MKVVWYQIGGSHAFGSVECMLYESNIPFISGNHNMEKGWEMIKQLYDQTHHMKTKGPVKKTMQDGPLPDKSWIYHHTELFSSENGANVLDRLATEEDLVTILMIRIPSADALCALMRAKIVSHFPKNRLLKWFHQTGTGASQPGDWYEPAIETMVTKEADIVTYCMPPMYLNVMQEFWVDKWDGKAVKYAPDPFKILDIFSKWDGNGSITDVDISGANRQGFINCIREDRLHSTYTANVNAIRKLENPDYDHHYNSSNYDSIVRCREEIMEHLPHVEDGNNR